MSLRKVQAKDPAEFGTISDQQSSYLRRLLKPDFKGAAELRAQLEYVMTRRLDENGSLEFYVQRGPRAEVTSRVPVEGYCCDEDGIRIHVLLHVLDGRVDELEIYKEDCSKVQKLPLPEELELIAQN